MLWSILIGMVAGWLAGQVSRGQGFGVLGNIVVGIIGAVVGNFLFGLLGLQSYGTLGSIVTSTVGAVLFLWVVRMFTGLPDRR